jgi:hypothetical protein
VSGWTWAWLAWGLMFCVIEGMALFNSRSSDTLSEHVWLFRGYSMTGRGPLRQPTGWTRLRRFVVLAGLAWLIVHLLTGGIF